MQGRGDRIETITVQAARRPHGHRIEEGEQESLERTHPVEVVQPIIWTTAGDDRQGEWEEEEAQQDIHEAQVDQENVIGGDLEEEKGREKEMNDIVVRLTAVNILWPFPWPSIAIQLHNFNLMSCSFPHHCLHLLFHSYYRSVGLQCSSSKECFPFNLRDNWWMHSILIWVVVEPIDKLLGSFLSRCLYCNWRSLS